MVFRSIIAALSFACLCLLGCASHLTAQEIDTYGTKKYVAPKDKLTDDIAAVLQGMGYEVVVADPEKGLVKTSRKEIGQSTQTTGRATRGRVSARSVSTSYFRQYVVNIKDNGKAAVVRVTPKVFIGERDVSNEKVWNIDGAGGERELWQSFFGELDSVVDESPAPSQVAKVEKETPAASEEGSPAKVEKDKDAKPASSDDAVSKDGEAAKVEEPKVTSAD
jgi:hypothetical protein